MNHAPLRWWLWTASTLAAMAVAGIFGLYGALLKNDITYLGLTACGLYVLTSAWIGITLLRGKTPGDFTWHMVEVIERTGLTGTVVGLVIAFMSVQTLDISSPEFKTAIVHGVMSKLLCSVCGLFGWFFLSTQLKILDVRQ